MNDNSIMVIHPYLHKGTWVFDDEDKGLAREPFIAGIDTMLSNIVDMKGLDKNGFSVLFSGLLDVSECPWLFKGSGGPVGLI